MFQKRSPRAVPRRRGAFVPGLACRGKDGGVGNVNRHVRSSLSISTLLAMCSFLYTNAFYVSNHQSSVVRTPAPPLTSPFVGRRLRVYYSSSASPSNIEKFTGPTMIGDDEQVVGGGDHVESLLCSLELEELGLVLSVAPSTHVAAGSLGLYCRISADVDETTLPALTLLAGYAKGTFQYEDQGDKTVGFSLTSRHAPVFYNRQLMTIEQALAAVATATVEVQLAGHNVYYDEDDKTIVVVPTSNHSNNDNNTEQMPFARYFVPNPNDQHDDDELMNITNIGQYCNDRAFVTGIGPVEYASRCATENCLRLVWRLEYDDDSKVLQPSWPVSVLARDMTFDNRQPIELGTTYGWNYWNASIALDRL
jgi:hypothetical protein